MYIPAWPSLNPAYFIRADRGERAPFPLESSSKTCFYVARSGIYHLMRSLELDKGEVVLVPDYHHGNEIYAMKAAGAKLRYYPVKRNLDVDLEALANLCEMEPKARVLYVTHFIGWPQPMNELRALCHDRKLVLIEDCALSFMSDFEGRPLGTFGDYSVFCLYKSLPLPNGGVLVRNRGEAGHEPALQPSSALSVTGRSTELMLHWLRSRYDRPGRALLALKRAAGRTLNAGKVRRVPVGNTGFDLSAVNVGMSPVCHTLLRRFQYKWIKETRRRNFRIVEDRLGGKVRLLEKPLSDGVCPLFFPILVKDKSTAARALSQRGIETIEFWNHGDPEVRLSGTGADFLRKHLLEVPIHQDVTPEAAEYTADQIVKLNLGLAA